MGDDPSWSESYYFYYFDPRQEIGGYTRLGFRPHDGWRDAVHVLYLEGSRIGFGYAREAHAQDETRVAVAGTQLPMGAPFEDWRIEFEGEIQDCPDGRVLVTPRKERPADGCRAGRAALSLEFDCTAPPFYTDRPGAGGHFEQPGRVRGRFAAGDRSWDFQGFGLRDKSWGPRPWTNQTGARDRDEPAGSPFGKRPGLAGLCRLAHLRLRIWPRLRGGSLTHCGWGHARHGLPGLGGALRAARGSEPRDPVRGR